MTRSPFTRNYKRDRLRQSVASVALDPRLVLFCARPDFQIHGLSHQPDAFASELHGFGQVLHRGLHAYAQTMARGRGERNAKTLGVFA